jgi:hypothetical protein
MVIVRPELSKAEHQYFTFLDPLLQVIPQIFASLLTQKSKVLEERIQIGESITPNSPIIRPKVVPKPFIRTVNIGDMIREAIRGAGFSWRPYVLRAYFDTQLMIAESKECQKLHP